MQHSFRLLLSHKPLQLVVLLLLNLLLGLTQGFSIVLLIPLLQLLEMDPGGSDNILVRLISDFFERTGLPLHFESILLVYVLTLSGIALLVYVRYIMQSRYQQGLTYGIRQRLFRKIIFSQWATLTATSRHNHLQVLTEEVPKLSDYYYCWLQIMSRLVIMLSLLAYALLLSPDLTMMVVVTGLIVFVLLRGFLIRTRRLGLSLVEVFTRLLKNIDDFWASMKIAKVHNSEDVYFERFDKANRRMLELEYRMNQTYAIPQLLYKLAAVMVLAGLVFLGYSRGEIPLSHFFILIVLFARILPQFAALNGELGQLSVLMAPLQMVLDLDQRLDETTQSSMTDPGRMALQKDIRLEGIHFAWPDGKTLFTDFHAMIPARSITCIVGETGRGKTTLVDMVAGLLQAAAGQLLVDGKVLEGNSLSAWKNSIGYLPQDAFFMDGTIRDNLVWDSRHQPDDKELLDVLKKVNALHLITQQPKGLDTHISNYPFRFSGGERQQLALARVLLRKPSLLILDEATSSLDTDNEARIMQTLTGLTTHTTILLVTHRSSVLPWCHEVIRL